MAFDSESSATSSSDEADDYFYCQACDEYFDLEIELSLHKERLHPNNDKTLPDKDKQVECSFCHAKLESFTDLGKHMVEQHSSIRPQSMAIDVRVSENFSCHNCKEQFDDISSMSRHVSSDCRPKRHAKAGLSSTRLDDEQSSFACPVCCGVYSSSALVRDHLHREHDNASLQNGLSNNSLEKTAMHIPKTSDEIADSYTNGDSTIANIYVCPICAGKFHSTEAVRQHIEFNHKSKTNVSSPPIDELNGRAYVCSVCEERFSSSTEVAHHRRSIHDMEDELSCHICENNPSFDSLFARNRHMVMEHKGVVQARDGAFHTRTRSRKVVSRSERFVCNVCGIAMPIGQLDNHMRTEHGAKPSKRLYRLPDDDTDPGGPLSDNTSDTNDSAPASHGCILCDAKFDSIVHVERHITAEHIRDGRFVCPICSKLFDTRSNIKRHIHQVHTLRNRRHPCTLCNQTFSRRSDVRRHVMSVHDKIKNYVCDQCGKSFAKSGHVERHIMSVHDKIKNYVCPLCEKAFSQKGDLKGHILSVHEKRRRRSGPLTICSI